MKPYYYAQAVDEDTKAKNVWAGIPALSLTTKGTWANSLVFYLLDAGDRSIDFTELL